MGVPSERKFGEKSVLFLLKTFFVWSSPEFGKKVFHLFFCFLVFTPEQNRGRGSSPPMLKIGQTWGKIAHYPLLC